MHVIGPLSKPAVVTFLLALLPSWSGDMSKPSKYPDYRDSSGTKVPSVTTIPPSGESGRSVLG
jgi:hypothetical protein